MKKKVKKILKLFKLPEKFKPLAKSLFKIGLDDVINKDTKLVKCNFNTLLCLDIPCEVLDNGYVFMLYTHKEKYPYLSLCISYFYNEKTNILYITQLDGRR